MTTERYGYRAYPSGDQRRALSRSFGCARVVYNDFLAERARLREAGEHKDISFSKTASVVTTGAKATPDRAWLSEVSSVVLQQSVRQAERAYRNWFDSLSGKHLLRTPKTPLIRGKDFPG
ncbi:transposase [uncultured Microbacterium sp.]|uniref:transposase n=1 Tax=uncultured Microbacterium sp. TaxID=191216 RepID=UPI00261FB90D|nr:transposase [uncultured Microbacterium sp.]